MGQCADLNFSEDNKEPPVLLSSDGDKFTTSKQIFENGDPSDKASKLAVAEVVTLALLLAIVAYILYQLLVAAYNEAKVWIFRMFLVSVQLTAGITPDTSRDSILYHRLLTHLGKHCDSQLQHRKVYTQATTTTDPNVSDESDNEEGTQIAPDYEWICRVKLAVGYGVSYVRYKGTFIRVMREIIKPATIATRGSNSCGQEKVTLTTFNWNKRKLNELLDKVKPKTFKKDSSKVVIYKADPDRSSWTRMGRSKRKRPLDTLVLDDKVVDNVLMDVKGFLEMEEWYVSRGIPFRRGYLLYGPPGCGKSSIVKVIAGELDYNICVFSLSQKLTDSGLTELFNKVPAKSVILLEDIDAAFKSREDLGASTRETNLAFEGCSASQLTFMGLLNALDGVASAEDGQLLFMTTNHPERLDPALIRPGRVDMKIHMGYPSDTQILGLFHNFYPEVKKEGLGKEFVKKARGLKDVKVTMAMLQGLMVIYREDPRKAIDNFDEHFKEQFANTQLAKENKAYALYC